MKLTKKDRELLLDIAESAILNYLDSNYEIDISQEKLSSEIMQETGAFVSVYIGKSLRGCIGTFSESDPLYENVKKMAVSAAFTDSRFRPIRKKETDQLLIEISVLTPRKRIYNPNEIVIGRHGIYIISGTNRGTLLPQVAEKNQWSSLEFLEYCAQYKTGLHKSGWRDAELYTYEAIVFSR
jgi:MEMO1 family protein